MKTLLHSLWTAFLMTLLLGLAYPLVLTGLAQTLVPGPANGSLVLGSDGTVLGSTLVGQDWSSSSLWFQGRLSATGGQPYNAQASGGSNLSPHGKAYADRVSAQRTKWEERGASGAPVPDALLTASGSGLDPDLDLQAALWQVPLVAMARNADPAAVEALVKNAVQPSGWPWDPVPWVNVLKLNLLLDQKFPKP